jgi:signal recognition particle receptor subunit beta
MSQIDTERNLLHARIVYWGPSGAGKTATLLALRPKLDPEHASRLYSLATPEGATVTFDLLAVEEFKLDPYRVRLRLVAVPGATARSAARLALLKEADAVVFVADSAPQAADANRASWQELQGTLKTRGLALPTVIAIHKRDLPDALPVGDVRRAFGIADAPVFETTSDGRGVLECFAEAFRLLVGVLARRHGIAIARTRRGPRASCPSSRAAPSPGRAARAATSSSAPGRASCPAPSSPSTRSSASCRRTWRRTRRSASSTSATAS